MPRAAPSARSSNRRFFELRTLLRFSPRQLRSGQDASVSIYYLHGLGDDGMIAELSAAGTSFELRRQGKVGDLVVLGAAAGGHTFYVNSADGKIRYEDFPHEGVYAADGEEVSGRRRAGDARHHRSFDGWLWSVTAGLQVSRRICRGERPDAALIADVPKDFTSGGPGSPGL